MDRSGVGVTVPGKQCVILVGGLGTRLGALTADTPKPLLEVAGKPFLAHMIGNALRFGFDEVVLLAGFRADKVAEFAEAVERRLPVRVRVVAEPAPAGTAGALTCARDLLADEFLMLNGDSMFDFNWLELATRPNRDTWVARLGLRHVDDSSRFGSVALEGAHITAFREKQDAGGPGLINGGVYWLRREILERIDTVPSSLERDVFPQLVKDGTIFGYPRKGCFVDIGVPQELERARENWNDMQRKPAAFFDRDGVLNYDEGYTHRIEEFRWKPGAREAIARCNAAGRMVFVVSNQAGIARGYYDAAAVEALHKWMAGDLRTIGAHIDDFRYCPHHPAGIITDLAVLCECRKPAPGMIKSLLTDWPVEMAESFLIGDKISDVEAAEAAGIRGHLLAPADNILDVCELLLRRPCA